MRKLVIDATRLPSIESGEELEGRLRNILQAFCRSSDSEARLQQGLVSLRLGVLHYLGWKSIPLSNAQNNAELRALAGAFKALAKKLNHSSADLKTALDGLSQFRPSVRTDDGTIASFADNQFDLPGIARMLEFIFEEWKAVEFLSRKRGAPPLELERDLIKFMAEIWSQVTGRSATGGKRAKAGSETPKFADLIQSVAEWINEGPALELHQLRVDVEQWGRLVSAVLSSNKRQE